MCSYAKVKRKLLSTVVHGGVKYIVYKNDQSVVQKMFIIIKSV